MRRLQRAPLTFLLQFVANCVAARHIFQMQFKERQRVCLPPFLSFCNKLPVFLERGGGIEGLVATHGYRLFLGGGGSTILKRVIKGHGRADVFSCCNLAGWWEGAGVEEIIC